MRAAEEPMPCQATSGSATPLSSTAAAPERISMSSYLCLDNPATLDGIQLRDLALDRIRQGLCVFDGKQRLLLFNRQYAQMYDLDPSQLWIGMTLRDVVDLRYAAGTGPLMPPEQYAAWRDRIGVADRVTDTEVTLGNGCVHAIHHEPTSGGGWVATFEDISERRRAEARVRHMAHHDALTDLPNRSLFGERLERTLARLRGESCLEDSRPNPAEPDWLIAVLFLDLDNFKNVNDALGHAAGDELLRQAAVRIGRCLRGHDTLSRLGGDEFAVLLEGLTTVEQAADVGQRIVASLSGPFMLNGKTASVGISVGITLCTRDMDADSALLLRQADHALYDAKAQGRGTYCFFDNGMEVMSKRVRAPRKKIELYQEENGLVGYQNGSGVSAEFP